MENGGEHNPEQFNLDSETATELLEMIRLIRFYRRMDMDYKVVLRGDNGIPLNEDERDWLFVELEERKMRRQGEI